MKVDELKSMSTNELEESLGFQIKTKIIQKL